MRRALLRCLTGALIVAGLASLTPAAGASVAGCAGRRPRALHLTRLAGPRARLSWRTPAALSSSGAPAPTYRVIRAGETVGQTSAGSLVLRVTPGRLTVFVVQARYSSGPSACSAKLRTKPQFRAPGKVGSLHVLSRNSSTLTIGWRSAARGDEALAGYRVRRDGAVVGETHGRTFTLRLTGGRPHRVTVAAVDVRGHLGPLSALAFGSNGQLLSSSSEGRPPSVPSGVGASEVSETGAAISWLASAPGSSRVVGTASTATANCWGRRAPRRCAWRTSPSPTTTRSR